MDEKKKVNENELSKLRQLVHDINNLKLQYATEELKKKEIDKYLETVYEKLTAKGKDYGEYLEHLRGIYGDVNIDFETGEVKTQEQQS